MGPVDRLEGALDDRLGGAGAHAAAGGALAEQERERVHQHRLAGAGLAGEDVEAGSEGEGDVGDRRRGRGRGARRALTIASRSERSPQCSFCRIRPKKPSPPSRIRQTRWSARRTSSTRPARAWLPTWPSTDTSRSSAQPTIGSITMPYVAGTTSGRTARVCAHDRRDDHRLDAGHHDRPAGAERIRGGAGRRGDDDAVGAVGPDVLALDVDVDPDHARDAALVHHDVVQRDRCRRARSRPSRLRSTATSARRGSVTYRPATSASSAGSSVSRVAVVQEADPAEVDAEDGISRAAEEPRAAEQRAVAAEGEQGVELDALEVEAARRPQNGAEPRLAVERDAAGGRLRGQRARAPSELG